MKTFAYFGIYFPSKLLNIKNNHNHNYFKRFYLQMVIIIIFSSIKYCNTSSNTSSILCPKLCDCKWKNGKETIACINTNLTTIPSKINPSIQVFDFIGNNLLFIRDDTFYKSGLINLQKLNLTKCKIKKLETYVFRMLRNLISLDLSSNYLTIIPSDTFESINELRELRLNNNPLLKIGNDAFTYLNQLIRLEIMNCKIGAIYKNAFNGLENSLEILKIDNNRIINLNSETITSLSFLQEFSFSNNPINCSCKLRPLRDWIFLNHIAIRQSPICKYPLSVTNSSFENLQNHEFACLTSVKIHHENVINKYEGDNVTFVCESLGNPFPNITWLHNATSITNRRSYIVKSKITGFSNLTIHTLQIHDSGLYSCIGENKAGKLQSKIELKVDKLLIDDDRSLLSEKLVFIGILLTVVVIVFLCSIVLFIRVMCYKSKTIDIIKPIIIRDDNNIVTQTVNTQTDNNNSNNNNNNNINNNNNNNNSNNYNIEEAEEDTCCLNQQVKQQSTVVNPETSVKSRSSPTDSMFDSHIGEMALHHHVLHKKELPSGNLYTTAMSFIQSEELAEDLGAEKTTKKVPPRPKDFDKSKLKNKTDVESSHVPVSETPLLGRNKHHRRYSAEDNTQVENRRKRHERNRLYGNRDRLERTQSYRPARKRMVTNYWCDYSPPSSPEDRRFRKNLHRYREESGKNLLAIHEDDKRKIPQFREEDKRNVPRHQERDRRKRYQGEDRRSVSRYQEEGKKSVSRHEDEDTSIVPLHREGDERNVPLYRERDKRKVTLHREEDRRKVPRYREEDRRNVLRYPEVERGNVPRFPDIDRRNVPRYLEDDRRNSSRYLEEDRANLELRKEYLERGITERLKRERETHRETLLSNSRYYDTLRDYSTYPARSPTSSISLDYHSTQLERFLDEYRQLHSELSKMKNECEQITQTGLRTSSIRTSSIAGSVTPERSVSFAPNLEQSPVKTITDVTIPKSILRNKSALDFGSSLLNESYDDVPSRYSGRRTRSRTYSDSSASYSYH